MIAFICSLILFVTVSKAQYQPCTTPNRVNGLCQPIKTCSSIVQLLQIKPLTLQNREFLQKSQCKADVQPWVCCPDEATPAPARPDDPPVKSAPPRAGRPGSLPKAPNCGLAADNRIFGGEETKLDEFPWLAQIQYNKPGNKKGFHCGGSLINQRYVITAAHCISKVPTDWKLTSVRLGEWDTTTVQDCDDTLVNDHWCNNPHVDVPVTEKIVHENYLPNSKNQHNDIALLRLSKNVQYTDFIKPICLPLDPSVRNLDLAGHSMEVAGWGKTETSSASTRKLKVVIDAYTNRQCGDIYGRSQITILDSQICAGGDPGRDSCNGDSGGPLMKFYERTNVPHYFLAGIVSYGPKNCGTEGVPGVYTRVSKYVDWIQANVKE